MQLNQQQRELPRGDSTFPMQSGPDSGGPRIPSITKPDTSRLIKRMREIESNQAKKYRQRSGQ